MDGFMGGSARRDMGFVRDFLHGIFVFPDTSGHFAHGFVFWS
jgi:hypothetical protein